MIVFISFFKGVLGTRFGSQRKLSREISARTLFGSLQVHTGYLTFSLKKNCFLCRAEITSVFVCWERRQQTMPVDFCTRWKASRARAFFSQCEEWRKNKKITSESRTPGGDAVSECATVSMAMTIFPPRLISPPIRTKRSGIFSRYSNPLHVSRDCWASSGL